MNDLVSIIVPVYNVEKYLNRCIESILRQTYEQLEIILVDDGSPDGCPDICDAWGERDKRIRVIHKKNGGLSDARNVGLANATGEYVAFVDSDDWIHEKYIESLYSAVVKYQVDIAACDVQKVHEEVQKEKELESFIDIYKTEDALHTLMNGTVFRAVVWNKLYRRRILDGERFEVGRYHEDEFFTYRIMGKARKMAFVNADLYYYFQREGSIMRTISYKHLDALDAHIERINYVQQNFPKLCRTDKVTFCVSCVNFYQKTFDLDGKEKKKYRDKITTCRRKISFSIQEYRESNWKERIYIVGSYLCIGFVSRLLSKRKIEK